MKYTERFWNRVCRVWEAAWNEGKFDGLDEVLAPGYVHHEPPSPDVVGREAYKQSIAGGRIAFSEARLAIGDLIIQGNKAAAPWTFEGTFIGSLPLFGVQGIGQHVSTGGIISLRCEGGRVVEAWVFEDTLSFFQQLGVAATASRQVEQNKAVVRRVVEELWNQRKFSLVDELFGPEWVAHTPLGERRGLDSMRRELVGFFAAFPDYRLTIDDLTGEADRVVLRGNNIMTHKGEFMGVQPTGKTLKVPEAIVYRLTGGKIVEGWTYWDTGDLMRQLGIVPPMETKA